MANYLDPTGTVTGTPGDDMISFLTAPSGVTFDASGGTDSVNVNFGGSSPLTVDVRGPNFPNDYISTFNLSFSTWAGASAYLTNVESILVKGSTANDSFWLRMLPLSQALAVNFDGGDGQDTLNLDWSHMNAALSFSASGSAITSSFGSFSNFETFSITASNGDDSIVTGSGADYVETGGGTDHVSTGGGDDTLSVSSSGGIFDAGDGNDIVSVNVAGSPSLTIDGGAGLDTLQLRWTSTSGPITFDAVAHSSSFGSFANFETFMMYGGSGADTISTLAGDDTIYGWAGDDQISAGGGNDTIYGGDGNDRIDGGSGNDTIYGQDGSNTIYGGDGSDIIYGDSGLWFKAATPGSNYLDAGAGNDTVRGGSGSDSIFGGDGNDTLTGGAGADHIDGGDGDDYLDGHGDQYSPDDLKPDVLIGGAGNDTFSAGFGDSVDGGSGTDTLIYNGLGGSEGIGADFSQLTSGGTLMIAGATLSGIEFLGSILGTDHNDYLIAGAVAPGSSSFSMSGNAGDDTLIGSGIRDYLAGGDGNDTIIGGSGDDDLNGGSGNDMLRGGVGTDDLTGGAGIDTYAGTIAELNGDRIFNFEQGERILITDADPANFEFSYADGVVRFNGAAVNIYYPFSGHLVASAAPEGGVQITLEPLPLATPDQIASELTTGFWDGGAHHFAVTQGGTITVNLTALNSAEQILARTALQEWSDIVGVNFAEVSSGGQILFDNSEADGTVAQTDATWSNGITSSATVHIASSWVNSYGTGLRSYSFQTYLHEIGHALGLGHPGNYNGDAAYQSDAMFRNDAWTTTVMSYFDQNENRYFSDLGFTRLYAVTPMAADIVAMQSLYGLSTTTRAGDTVYGVHGNAGDLFDISMLSFATLTLFDSGGIDTIDLSDSGSYQWINLNPESYSDIEGHRGSLWISRGTIIENAVGGNLNDQILGNNADNHLWGGPGDDRLEGGAGNDILDGGTGNDTLIGGAGGDAFRGGDGVDTVIFSTATNLDLVDTSHSSGDAIGDSFDSIEIIRLSDYADNVGGSIYDDFLSLGDGNDIADGHRGNDSIFGEGGDDLLSGGAGDDVLHGGSGNDTALYLFATGGVLANLDSGHSSALWGDAGNDTLYDIENLRGSANADVLIGSNIANSIDGGGGDDVLFGQGGADVLTGGAGADRFLYVSQWDSGPIVSDHINEFETGIDKIDLRQAQAGRSFSFSLSTFGTETMVWIDFGGDGSTDMRLILSGNRTIAGSDFLVNSMAETGSASLAMPAHVELLGAALVQPGEF